MVPPQGGVGHQRPPFVLGVQVDSWQFLTFLAFLALGDPWPFLVTTGKDFWRNCWRDFWRDCFETTCPKTCENLEKIAPRPWKIEPWSL